MRFARPHIAFQLLLSLSIIVFLGALATALHSEGACDDKGGSFTPAKDCAISAAAEQTMANIIGMAALAFMIGGVGFQIGRGSGMPMQAPPQGMAAPMAPPQFPPPGGMPQQQGAPQQQIRQPDPGQWSSPPADRQ